MLRFAFNSTGLTALSAPILALLASVVHAAPTASDTISPGYAAHVEHAVGLFDAYATLPNGDRVVFDGTVVWREADDGTFLQQLGTVPAYVYPSFVLPDPSTTFALVGESSRGKIYRIDLAGSGMQMLADLDYNYDAKFEDAGHVLVSAAPCGFNCGSEIHRIDLSTGAMSLLATVSGPSGPLAVAANGDLYYGVNPDFPTITGSIVRWSAAQVSSGAVLQEASATIIVPTIDPSSSMAIEPVFGHLFVAQALFGTPAHVVEYSPNGHFLGNVAESLEFLSGIEFLRTQGLGSFGAFQPDGVHLLYRATDYSANTSESRSLRTRRPRAYTSGPGLTGPGLVDFTVRGAHPNSSFLVLMGAAASYSPNETSHDFGFFLFHTGMPLAGIRRLGSVATDANGEGSFQFFNQAGAQDTRVFQGLIRGANGTFVGSSTEAFN